MIHVKRHVTIVLLLFGILLLSACAGYGPNNGMIGSSKEHIIQHLGKPTTELQTPEGAVMIFSKGPRGKETFFIYLDSNGVMHRWAQVLDENHFDRIRPGMTPDQVIEIIGESKDRFGLARGRGYVWNYRYINPFCFWFQIEFAADNTVRSTGYGKPPECRIPNIR